MSEEQRTDAADISGIGAFHSHGSEKKVWPNYILKGRMRTSTAALIVAFLALFWVYQTFTPAVEPATPANQVVPPGFVPDPEYTWVPRTQVYSPRTTYATTATTTTTTTTTPTDTDTATTQTSPDTLTSPTSPGAPPTTTIEGPVPMVDPDGPGPLPPQPVTTTVTTQTTTGQVPGSPRATTTTIAPR